MDEIYCVGADELFWFVAENALDGRADERDGVVAVGDGRVFTGELDDALEARLIASQLDFGPGLFGGVATDQHHFRRPALHDAVVEGVPTVVVVVERRIGYDLVRRQCLQQIRFDERDDLRGKKGVESFAEELVRRYVDSFGGGVAIVEERELRRNSEE